MYRWAAGGVYFWWAFTPAKASCFHAHWKGIQHSRGKVIKTFKAIFKKKKKIIHRTPDLLFSLFVNVLGEKITSASVWCQVCCFEGFGIFSTQHIWYGRMLFNRRFIYFFVIVVIFQVIPSQKTFSWTRSLPIINHSQITTAKLKAHLSRHAGHRSQLKQYWYPTEIPEEVQTWSAW